jgi:hypothetical protein
MAGSFMRPIVCDGSSQAASLANTRGTAITAGGAAYGSWVQLVPSTPQDTSFIIVNIETAVATVASQAIGVNIGFGAAGSEKIVLQDLNVLLLGTATYYSATYAFPVNIPVGSAISAQACGVKSGSADVAYVHLQLFDGEFTQLQCAGVDSIGATFGGAIGTALLLPASTATKSSWVQMTPSTPRDYVGLGWAFTAYSDVTNVNNVDRYYADIAIGAAGSEQVIVPNIWINLTSVGSDGLQISNAARLAQVIPIQIPAGTKISVRAQSGANISRNTALIAYGLYQ